MNSAMKHVTMTATQVRNNFFDILKAAKYGS